MNPRSGVEYRLTGSGKEQKTWPRESPLNKVTVYHLFGYSSSIRWYRDSHYRICLGTLVDKILPF
ncbi:MAG: hypothetical protein VXY74_13385, partial [SAR324 cluster bacterium]|nr:hypothetical protein [SAR324 cluster bacterium]